MCVRMDHVKLTGRQWLCVQLAMQTRIDYLMERIKEDPDYQQWKLDLDETKAALAALRGGA